MSETITLDEITLFAYNEVTDSARGETILNALLLNNELLQAFIDISEMRNLFENETLSPSDDVVRNVLSFNDALEILNVPPPAPKAMIKN